MSRKKVAFFIPVWNEGEMLQQTLENLPWYFPDFDIECDLFIMDDHSSDQSFKVAQAFTPHAFRMEENRGVGAATKAGFQEIARVGNYHSVIKFDGDGQHDLSMIPMVLKQLVAGDDLVICSRFHPDSDQSNTPIDRLLLNLMFTDLLKRITGQSFSDVRSGFMGIKFEYIPLLADNTITERYGIPMEIILRLWNKNPAAEITTLYQDALYGEEISLKLGQKLEQESNSDRAKRAFDAYLSVLNVIDSLGIDKEHILALNGFKTN